MDDLERLQNLMDMIACDDHVGALKKHSDVRDRAEELGLRPWQWVHVESLLVPTNYGETEELSERINELDELTCANDQENACFTVLDAQERAAAAAYRIGLEDGQLLASARLGTAHASV